MLVGVWCPSCGSVDECWLPNFGLPNVDRNDFSMPEAGRLVFDVAWAAVVSLCVDGLFASWSGTPVPDIAGEGTDGGATGEASTSAGGLGCSIFAI